MPVYRQRTVLELARGVRAFLNLDLGLVHGKVPGSSGVQDVELERARKQLVTVREQLARRERELAEFRTKMSGNDAGAVSPEKMVWIFGTGRSGSTWLRSMMSEMKGHAVWEEPMVGKLFGRFYNGAQTGQLSSPKFILGNPTRSGWIKSVRNFVLDGARYANPRLRPGQYLVIKEPNGSDGAPLLMEALPESRMIFLIRDPRDVVASVLDGARKGSWLYERKDKEHPGVTLPNTQPNFFVEHRAEEFMRHVTGARRAYEVHEGRKVLVKYEDLLADTLSTVRRIYSTLEMPFEEEELERVVKKHSWENIPENQKGTGKFYRKATPGGWREDLTPEQVEIVEGLTDEILEEFYPD